MLGVLLFRDVIILSSYFESLVGAVFAGSLISLDVHGSHSLAVLQTTTHQNYTPLSNQCNSQIVSHFSSLYRNPEFTDLIMTNSDQSASRLCHSVIVFSRVPNIYNQSIFMQPTNQYKFTFPSEFYSKSILIDNLIEFIYTDNCSILIDQTLEQNGQTLRDHQQLIGAKSGTSKSAKKKLKQKTKSAKDDSMGESILTETEIGDIEESIKRLTDQLNEFKHLANSVKMDSLVKRVTHKLSGTLTPFSGQSTSSVYRLEQRADWLSDVILCTNDKKQLTAHRCVLAARSEYFSCMLSGQIWAEGYTNNPLNPPETHKSQKLNFPVDFDVGEAILCYLYSDTLPDKLSCVSESDADWLDVLFRLLMAADQLLMDNLKMVKLCAEIIV